MTFSLFMILSLLYILSIVTSFILFVIAKRICGSDYLTDIDEQFFTYVCFVPLLNIGMSCGIILAYFTSDRNFRQGKSNA